MAVSTNPYVSTTPKVTLQLGSQGLLACNVATKVFTVSWKKITSPTESRTLVIIDMYLHVGNKLWPENSAEFYGVVDDFSLLIYNVRIEDMGQYLCEITELETDLSFQSQTNVTVFGRLFI